ncbi:hypothetical protein BG015_006647, partial [Linnemannia schmuckeri]
MSSAGRSVLPSIGYLYTPPLKARQSSKRKIKRRVDPKPRYSFFVYVKGLLLVKVAYDTLCKKDKDHLRRTHSETPVKVPDPATG